MSLCRVLPFYTEPLADLILKATHSALNWAENDINDHVSLVDTNRALRQFSAQSNDQGLLVDSDAYIETVS